MRQGLDPGAETTARIPLDVLATWLAADAIDRIARTIGPQRQAAQVDLELDRVGLAAKWEDGEDGPVLVEVRLKDQTEGTAESEG
ncbi:hypothetical protein [Methylobacterium sp. WL9]|uniref:hypothetical protein n=1 Tax=Methylobacterium sp. WL9 TaxID=2603898 RepID=UPI0011C88EA9|nr:hypothetical protein [Methylobacterium sp. WL9]TXN21018.1 hypothetical protein FV217_15790 [Methylobacterium sp. WL9]